MTSPQKPSGTFVCPYCQLNRSRDLAVEYKPARGATITICAHCENVIIGYGESAGIDAIRRAADGRSCHQLRLKGATQ